MKLIIADDEPLVRISLKSMLTELDLPLEVVGEAANGEEMVDLVAKFLPDVVFVDIKMPKLNGLAGIKAGKEVSPNTQWIILTGFSEFDFAQEAIKLGATRYLLKPVSPEQLLEALQVVMAENQKIIHQLNQEFENDLIALFHGLTTLPYETEKNILANARYRAVLFFIDSQLEESLKAERQRLFCNKLRQVIAELLNNETRFALFCNPNGELVTVAMWGVMPNSHGQRISEVYFSRVRQICEELNHEQFVITTFQTEADHSFEELLNQVEQLEEISSLRIIYGVGNWFSLQELIHSSNDKGLTLSNQLLQLSQTYKEGNYASFMRCLRDIEKIVANFEPDLNLGKKVIVDFIRRSLGCSLASEKGINSWLKNLEIFGENLLKNQNRTKNADSDMVEQTVNYIEQNYRFDIGISQIAERLHVSPNYLSTLFHKKTGTGFMKYLTEIRMMKAKELLANSNLQVQQVAEEVGYYSVRHFTKLFTQFVGCYPSEYRRSLKK